ncbi:MAG: hypothetical protein JSV45_08380 [Chromatiales bacterium]|nr:MAG: hypothetical protein JSV45_08380 [Chromatiales bacterium]
MARSAVVGGIALLSLAPGAATAVGLGEAVPSSALGEPLRATVPMRLGPGEVVRPGCVTSPARQGGDLRSPASTRVRTPQTTGPAVLELEVTSRQPLYEPLYELTLRVDCPGLPKIMRHYVLMLDLPGLSVPAASAATVTRPSQGATATVARSNAAPGSAPRRLAATREPIAAGQVYRVREGDTLSTIAARVEGRAPNSTWQLADQIFAANPRAFIRGNPDLIKLGYEIAIPVSGQLAASPAAPAQPETPAPVAPAAEPAARATSTDTGTAAAQSTLSQTQAARSATTLTEDTPVSGTSTTVQAGTETADVSQDIVLPPASTSPFADESNTRESSAAATDIAEAPPPVALAPRSTSQVSPLLAVLLGLLLGLGLSIVLLRSHLLQGLSRLFARGRADTTVKSDEQSYGDTDEWLKTEQGLHAEAFALGTPAEQTYIVEVDDDDDEAKATRSEEIPVVEGTADFDSPFAPPASEYQPELEYMATAEASGPTEPADTAEIPNSGPTMEMPRMAHADTVDTVDTVDDELEEPETVAMAEAGFDPTVEPELAELFAEDLSDLPGEPDLPVEAFGGIEDDPDNSILGPTVDMPRSEIPADPLLEATVEAANPGLEGLEADADGTEDPALQCLGDDSAEEHDLSATLQQAMSLLEKDFNDELTASQIIDQDALKRAVGEGELGSDETDMLQDPPRKRAG